MADKVTEITAATGTTIHNGAGILVGIVVTNTAAAGALCTVYDNTAAAGIKLFELAVSCSAPVIILLRPENTVKFSTGLHVVTAAGVYATVWSRGP